jgi:hypothetical protein
VSDAELSPPPHHVVRMRMPRSRHGAILPPTPDRGSDDDLEWTAAAAGSCAALFVAIRHWADHGGELAEHIEVALRGASQS